jgi:dihydrofolate reductase
MRIRTAPPMRRCARQFEQARRTDMESFRDFDRDTWVAGHDEAGAFKLKADTQGDVVVHGSATLVHALVDKGLVDEFRLMVFPVILGG